jgi:N-acylneuraminate cytidylyltransferase
MRWVALMPLRAGSKSIPGKNLRPLAGRPLFAWSLGEAIASACFDAVYVATDSEEIGTLANALFPGQVQVVDRSPETATDTASTESVMLEFQGRHPFDVLCLIQATSPLTRAAHFRGAREKFEVEGLDSLLSGVETRRFFWTPRGRPLNYDPAARPRRQDFEGAYLENGAFYLTRAAILRDTRCRLGGRIGIYPMPPETAIEIDEPADWAVAERGLLESRRAPEATTGIRALVVDVDGTLTDGGMYYGASGEALKRFDTRDGKGLEQLRTRGRMIVCVITGEDSPAVAARMRKLRIEHYFPGVQDKLPVLEDWARRLGLRLEQIAYMGDDLGDLECLTAVGFALCPADAALEVRAAADYICSCAGGAGAVREACELLLGTRGA